MIEIYTDGACKGNGKSDAVGGWGFHAVDRYSGERIKQDFGGEQGTTNNRMELQAAIEALKFAKTLPQSDKMRVKIHTDSNYVYKGITTWIHGWIRKDWKDVKNVDQWKELDQLNNDLYDWNWVKAHNGHSDNEYADHLANKGCSTLEMVEHSNELAECGIEKKERFISAMESIYAISRVSAIELFDKYSNQEAHDYHSVSNRVFVEIMEN